MSDATPQPQPKVLTPQQIAVGTVCQVCGWEPSLCGGRAAKLWGQLKKLGATVEELEAAYGQTDSGAAWWWYRDHWLGKRGDPPDDRWIRETWARRTMPVAVQMPTKYASLDAWAERGHGND